MRGRARAARRGARGLRALGGARHARSARSPTRGRLRVLDGDELVGDMPVDALVDDCPLYDLEPEEPAEPIYPAPPRRLADGRRRRARRCSRCCGSPTIASQALRLRAVRLDRGLAHRAAPAGGRRRGARARARRRQRRHRGVDRRQRPAGGLRSRTRARWRRCSSARRNLACVGAEPLGLTNCLNFGNPEKPHIAWQLTRAVEGLARRLPGARRAGGGRQRLALQRGRRTGRSTRRRSWAWSASCPTRRARAARRASRARATRSRCVGPVRAVAGRLRAGEAARRAAPTGCPTSTSSAAAARAGRAARGRARRRAGHGARRLGGRPGRALAECCIAGGLGARVDLVARGGEPPTALLRRGPGRRPGRRAARDRERSAGRGRSARSAATCRRIAGRLDAGRWPPGEASRRDPAAFALSGAAVATPPALVPCSGSREPRARHASPDPADRLP